MAMPTEVKQGDDAPDFDLPTDGGGRFSLAGACGNPVVLYFYPKDDTSGCTLEALDFTAKASDFAEIGVAIVGISPDTVKKHDAFKAKHGLALRLAADPERQAIDAYGVWAEKSMYGRKYMGVDRSTFLIDRDGVVARVWRNVKVPGHVDDVLEAARMIAATSG
jgi:peroxiredoxin Q/BCP